MVLLVAFRVFVRCLTVGPFCKTAGFLRAVCGFYGVVERIFERFSNGSSGQTSRFPDSTESLGDFSALASFGIDF